MTETNETGGDDRPATEGRRSLAIVALLFAFAAVLIVGATAVDVLDDGADVTLAPPDARGFPRETGVGLCISVAPDDTVAAEDLLAHVAERVERQPHLFPADSTVASVSTRDDGSIVLTARPLGTDGSATDKTDADPCSSVTEGWSAAVSRDLLSDGADRLLAGADISDPWAGTVDVTHDPEDAGLRSLLSFTGPIGISGTCWVDETLSLDADAGRAVVTATSGDDAGLPGMVACNRFASSMPDGAAGEQALALVPHGSDLTIGDVRLLAATVEVTAGAIIVRGRIDAG